jgi:hypothetical protein
MTVREMISAIQHEVRDEPDLQPHRACQILNRLGALTGNCLDAIRLAEHDYNLEIMGHIDCGDSNARAKAKAQVTPSYQALREAQDALKLTETMIASLKYHIRVAGQEMELSR